MGPKLGEQDEFEGIYTEKFRGLARPFGEFIKYERDRAAIDIGVHLTEATNRGFRTVANTRVWFQLKGKRSSTLKLNDFAKCSEVCLKLKIEDLRFWYASPEPVYLVVYIESADIFLAEDIRDIVDRQWREGIFIAEAFRKGQKMTTVRILKSAHLDDDLFQRMLTHHSLRIDGPSFRGRPLGHRLDPLRCIPEKMDPSVFSEVVGRLLSAYGYQVTEQLDATQLFPCIDCSGDIVSLSSGVMGYTYEWIWQMSTQFGLDLNSQFRSEGEVLHIQGSCAVLIHSNKMSYPDKSALKGLARELVETRDIRRLLVFVNDNDDLAYYGSFRGPLDGTGLECMPQNLGDLAFNLLTATLVYLDYRDKISWKLLNYLY